MGLAKNIKAILGMDQGIALNGLVKNPGKKNPAKLLKFENVDIILRKQFCDNLATRIYKLRNKVVHTKKYDKNNVFEVFTPTVSNFSELNNDLKLLRVLSFALMSLK